MTIIEGDYPTRSAGRTRTRDASSQEPAPRLDPAQKNSAAPAADTLESAGAKIRAQLVGMQRAVSRQQRLLGGLIGLRELMQAEPGAAADRLESHIAGVTYRGEPVLEPLRGELKKIAAAGDVRALEAQIAAAEQEIARLSVSLGKYEIAEQNARSLAARESLTEIARGLRREGGLPQRLSREQVLKLLG
jgi:hypothetical protein